MSGGTYMKARDNHIKIGLFYVLSVLLIRLLLGILLEHVIFKSSRDSRIIVDATYFLASIGVVGLGYFLQRYSILETIEETYQISFYWTMSLLSLEVLVMIIFRDVTPFKTLGFYFYFICFYFSPILYRFFKRV